MNINRVFLIVPLTLLALTVVTNEAAAATSYALVVGNNTSQSPDLPTLQYADDDALRTGRLLEGLGVNVVVLAHPDDDTTRLYPNQKGTPVTRAKVLEAMDRLVNELSDAPDSHQRVLYFVFSGHGSYDDEGRGFLHMEDGRLTTRDLFSHLIAPTAGVCDVVIVLDSCNAEFLVQSRGSATRRRAGAGTLQMEDYDHVGLVLSASLTGETREWGRYLGGIFSHQFRSAISGGADANCDGEVSFPELAGFLDAANSAIANPQFRLKPYVRPPLGHPKLFIASPGKAPGLVPLELDGARPLRASIFDEHLLRYADYHVGAGCPTTVGLLPGTTYTVRVGGRDYSAPAVTGSALKLSALSPEPSGRITAKGADAYFLKHLFEAPYSEKYYQRYTSGPYQHSLVVSHSYPRAWYDNPVGWIAVGAGVASAVTAGVMLSLAMDSRDKAQNSIWAEDIAGYNKDVNRYNTASGILWGVAGAALSAGVALFIWDRPWVEEQVVPQFSAPLIHPEENPDNGNK